MEWCNKTLIEHKEYIKENGVDMPEIVNWNYEDSKIKLEEIN